MKFIMGDFMGFGAIGLVYEGFGSYLLSHIIFFTLIVLAVIGCFTVMKWIFTGRRPKETPGQKWMRTGRMDWAKAVRDHGFFLMREISRTIFSTPLHRNHANSLSMSSARWKPKRTITAQQNSQYINTHDVGKGTSNIDKHPLKPLDIPKGYGYFRIPTLLIRAPAIIRNQLDHNGICNIQIHC